jgi:hypothetical protein
MRYERWQYSPHDVGGSTSLPWPRRFHVRHLGDWAGKLAGVQSIEWLEPALLRVHPGVTPFTHLTSWEGYDGLYPVFGGGALSILVQKYYSPSMHWWLLRIRLLDSGIGGGHAYGEIVLDPYTSGDSLFQIAWVSVTGFDPAEMNFGLELRPALWTEFPP